MGDFLFVSFKVFLIIFSLMAVIRITFDIKWKATLEEAIANIIIVYILSASITWLLFDQIFTITMAWG